MTSNFRSFLDIESALGGYLLGSVMSGISSWLNEGIVMEGRKDRSKLAAQDFTTRTGLFGDEEDPVGRIDQHIATSGEEGEVCPITPLSGYASHIAAIQKFAHTSPENFAQVLMFSPLSANTSFAKHWDNFYALLLILKHHFPDKVTKQQIEAAVDAFGDKYHMLAHTIGGWKLDTIADVWSNKDELFHTLNKMAAGGDDVSLIQRLTQIKGVQPVKAGFIVQLLWGRAGCIDTHNIDIYSKAFPDMDKAGDFDEKQWSKKGGVEKYVDVLGKLNKRGIGTQQLWDVWVDFVESMYVMITSHGRGYYDMQGPALDPDAGEYSDLKGLTIPKKGIGRDARGVMVPVVGGKLGRGASATHLPIEPDEALKQFYQMYRRGQRGSDAARAVAFRKNTKGQPLDQSLGVEPTALHYFGPAVAGAGGDIDPDHIRHIIRQRLATGGKKAKRAAWNKQQGELFS